MRQDIRVTMRHKVLCGKSRGKVHLSMSCMHFEGTLAMHDTTVMLACNVETCCRQAIKMIQACRSCSKHEQACLGDDQSYHLD